MCHSRLTLFRLDRRKKNWTGTFEINTFVLGTVTVLTCEVGFRDQTGVHFQCIHFLRKNQSHFLFTSVGTTRGHAIIRVNVVVLVFVTIS